MTKLILAVIFLAGFAFSDRPADLEAKCATPDFAAEYENSSAVFEGDVVEAEKIGDKKVFVFEVRRFWKGVESKRVKVSVNESMRFQAFFEEGKTYLVFAKRNEDGGELFDGRCSRSAEIGGFSDSLKGDLEKLGTARTCIELKDKEKNEDE